MYENVQKLLNTEQLREGFLKYTRKVFFMLPEMEKPKILDIGCGTGLPTLELAELSKGEITGIDINRTVLDKFKVKLEKKGLSDRIKVLNCSFYKNGLSENNFDLLWDEGVLHLLDTKKSVKECYRLLKQGGFLVLGETVKWLSSEVEKFTRFGFELKNRFLLPEESWWTEYFEPLEKKIKDLSVQYAGSRIITRLKRYERQIKMVKKNPREFDCAFYILQKYD